MGERRLGKYLSYALAASALILSAVFISSYWPFTLDDSFITFRYAMNLATGHGPVYNPGLPPAEGYTSFLWVVVMALPHLMGVSAEIFSKLVGIAAYGLILFVSYKFVAWRLAGFHALYRHAASALVLALNASFYAGASHVVSGMETMPYTAFLTVFLYVLSRAMDATHGGGDVAGREYKMYFLLAAVFGLMAGLTRPEGNLAVSVAFISAMLLTLHHRSGPEGADAGRDTRLVRLLLMVFVVFYLVPYALYFGWRIYYYGHFFPLPFYIKVSNVPLSGLPDVLSFFNYMGSRVGILVLAGALLYGRSMLPAILGVLSLVLFFIFPRHLQGFNYRFMYPMVPFIFILAAIGAGVLLRAIASAGKEAGRGRLASAVMIGICLISPLLFIKGYPANLSKSIGLYEGKKYAHGALGKRLNAFSSDASMVLAISDAGMVPYLSQWKTIDTFSLNDAHIAISGDHSPEYLFSQEPDVLVLVSRSAQRYVAYHQWSAGLYAGALARGWYPVKQLSFGRGQADHFLWVLALPGTPIWNNLNRWDGG